MTELAEQAILDFYTYPPIGGDDWSYTFETAQVHALEMQMLTRVTLQDMANASGFQQAADLLSGTEYALPAGGRNFAEVQDVLLQRRAAIRALFADLILDKSIVRLFKTRDDFANLRLAVRRTLTEKPLGADYSSDGNVPAEQIEQIFAEKEDFGELPHHKKPSQ